MLERKDEDSLINMLSNVNFDLKQNMLTDCPLPSLEYLTLTKIAISLWKVHLEKEEIDKFYYVSRYKRKILNIVPNLLVPNTCIEDLKQIVIWVGNEMSHNFLVNKLTSFKKLKVNLKNLCWNDQGTINSLKTAIKIIDDTNLTTLEKYEIACDFCLKDMIRDLQKRLSKTDIDYLGKIKSCSLTTFWSLYIKNDKTLPILIKGVPALDYLRRRLKKTLHSEVAIHYIWENFADETWKEQVACIVSEVKCFSNITLYFLPQMTQSQLEQTCLGIYQSLLYKLKSISIWNKYISLLKYACEIIKIENCVISSFIMVRFCWRNIFPNFNDCITVWNAFVLHFKPSIEERAIFLYETALHFVGFASKQGLFVKLLFDLANSEDRQTLIYSKKTRMFCRRLLCEDEAEREFLFKELPYKDGLESFHIFINLIMEKNEISQFKKKFFQVEKMNIFSNLIIDKKYELLDKILNKYHTADTLNEFKKKYCIKIVESLPKEIIRKEAKLLSVVIHFLEWCLEGDTNEIAKYKAFLVNLKSNLLINKICSIILWGKWILVRKYWKSILCTKRNNTNSNEKSLSYMRKKNCPGLLKRLLTSCFEKDEVKELQEQLRHNDELLLQVKELIELKDLPEVDGLLSWCFSSDENKICDFKTKFMKAFGCPLLFQFIECDDIEEVKSILNWFNPSVESAKRFREILTKFVSNEKKIKLDGKETKEKKNKKMLIERIHRSFKLLNCYIKENCVLDNENNSGNEHSKKRKIAERKEPIRRSKRKKIYN